VQGQATLWQGYVFGQQAQQYLTKKNTSNKLPTLLAMAQVIVQTKILHQQYWLIRIV